MTTGLGPAVIALNTQELPDGPTLVTFQVAAPLPDSIWLALLTATTTGPEHAPALDEALSEVADALEVERTPSVG